MHQSPRACRMSHKGATLSTAISRQAACSNANRVAARVPALTTRRAVTLDFAAIHGPLFQRRRTIVAPKRSFGLSSAAKMRRRSFRPSKVFQSYNGEKRTGPEKKTAPKRNPEAVC